MGNFTQNNLIKNGGDAASAGTAQVTGTTIDTQGYDNITFLTKIGTANAGNYIKVQSGAESDMSDAADLTGTKVAAAADNDVVGAEIVKPLERYLRLIGIRGVSTTLGDIIVILSNGRVMPPDNTVTGETNIEIHISPAEGTA